MSSIGSITSNIGALEALNAIAASQTRAGALGQELSTGLDINSPADNPVGFIEATGLSRVTDGLTEASANTSQGINLLQTAESAVGQMQNIIDKLNSIANQAANGDITPDERTAMQGVVNQYLGQFANIVEDTQFNNINLLDGTFVDKQFQVGAEEGQTLVVSLPGWQWCDPFPGSGGTSGNFPVYGVDIPIAGQSPSSITIVGPKGTTTVPVTTGQDPKSIASAINAKSGSTGVHARSYTGAPVKFEGASGASYTITVGHGTDTSPSGTYTVSGTPSGIAKEINAHSGSTGIVAALGSSGGVPVVTISDGSGKSISVTGMHSNGGSLVVPAVPGSDLSSASAEHVGVHPGGGFTIPSGNSIQLYGSGSFTATEGGVPSGSGTFHASSPGMPGGQAGGLPLPTGVHSGPGGAGVGSSGGFGGGGRTPGASGSGGGGGGGGYGRTYPSGGGGVWWISSGGRGGNGGGTGSSPANSGVAGSSGITYPGQGGGGQTPAPSGSPSGSSPPPSPTPNPPNSAHYVAGSGGLADVTTGYSTVIAGPKGSATITIAKGESHTAIAQAINAVSGQTGVVAKGTGAGSGIAAAQVGLSAHGIDPNAPDQIFMMTVTDSTGSVTASASSASMSSLASQINAAGLGIMASVQSASGAGHDHRGTINLVSSGSFVVSKVGVKLQAGTGSGGYYIYRGTTDMTSGNTIEFEQTNINNISQSGPALEAPAYPVAYSKFSSSGSTNTPIMGFGNFAAPLYIGDGAPYLSGTETPVSLTATKGSGFVLQGMGNFSVTSTPSGGGSASVSSGKLDTSPSAVLPSGSPILSAPLPASAAPSAFGSHDPLVGPVKTPSGQPEIPQPASGPTVRTTSGQSVVAPVGYDPGNVGKLIIPTAGVLPNCPLQINVLSVPLANRSIITTARVQKYLDYLQSYLGSEQQRFSATLSNDTSENTNLQDGLSVVQDADIPSVTEQLSDIDIQNQAGIVALKESTALQQSFIGLLP